MTHRTLILRVERTDGLKEVTSFARGFLVAESTVCLRFSPPGVLFTGAGLNMEARVGFALCGIIYMCH